MVAAFMDTGAVAITANKGASGSVGMEDSTEIPIRGDSFPAYSLILLILRLRAY